MRVVVERSALADAVKWAHGAVSTIAHLPALSGVLLTADEGKLTLRATDGSVTVEAVLDAAVDQPGTVLLPRRIANVLSRLPDAPVSITVDEVATVKCGRSTARVATLDVHDFPPPPALEDPVETKVGAALIERVAKLVCPVTGEARNNMFFLPFVCFDSNDDRTRWFASDSYRAKWVEGSGGAEMRFSTLPVLWTSAPTGGGAVVRFDGTLAQVSDGERTVTVGVRTDPYPSIDERARPGEPTMAWKADRAELLASLKRMESMGVMTGLMMRVAAEGGAWALSCRTLGDELDDLVEVSGDDALTFHVSPRYLRDAVESHQADTVIVGTDGQMRPLSVLSDDRQVLSLVMPMNPANKD